MAEKENIIYCYTGTGNCLASAKILAERLNATIKFITRELTESKAEIICDVCVVVAPSYGYGLPIQVRKFLKECPINADYLCVMITYGSSAGGTGAEAVRILRRKKTRVDYACGTQAVENYVHIFGFTKEEKQKTRIERQRENTENICTEIENRKTNKVLTFRPLSLLVSFFLRTFTPLFAKSYRIKNTCNGCEICRRVCPNGAIYMKDKNGENRPKFKARLCDHCQACMQLCPKRAIKYMRITPKSPRYLHSDVKLSELMKRD